MYNEEFERDEFVLNSASSNGSSHRSSAESDDVVIKHYYNSQRRFSDKEIESMRKSFETVVVNDFSDEYHLSDEERFENAEIAKLSKALAKTKRRCNNLYDYVIAMRLRMDVIEYVAKTNMVFAPEKFMKKVLKGDIVLNGLSFPKYTGKNKKGTNWEYISEFILDRSRDPHELKKQKYHPTDIDEIDDLDEFRKSVFSPDMFRDIFEDPMDTNSLDAPTIDIDEISGKKLKKLYGEEIYRNMFAGGKAFKDKVSTAKALGFIFEKSNELDDVARLDDTRRLKNNALKMPEFDGDYNSNDDVRAWLYRVKKWEDENVLVQSGNGRITQGQANEMQLRDFLDKLGWNVRSFAIQAKGDKKSKKRNRRRDKKRTDSVAANIKDATYRKKKKKEKHKRESDDVKDSINNVLDDMLVGLSDGGYEDFESYEKDMSECSYKSVFGKD